MGDVIPFRLRQRPQPVPAQTRGQFQCACGCDKFELFDTGTIECAECYESLFMADQPVLHDAREAQRTG